jgi:RimJ/RimL family protein N-acetyltransferase
MTRDQNAEMIARLEAHFDEYGYSFYAVDVLDTGEFIGFAGLSHPAGFEAWLVPCVEIGWRLRNFDHPKIKAGHPLRRNVVYEVYPPVNCTH